jgi:integrase
VKRSLPAYCYLHRRKSGEYVEFRRGSSVMMKAKPGTPEFAIEYAKLLNGVAEPATVKRNFAGLVKRYCTSPKYTKLSPRSKSDYEKILTWVVDALGPLPVAGLRRKDVIRARDENAETMRFANYIVQVLSILSEYAIDLGWREDNPAKGVHKLQSGDPAREPWPAELIEAYRANATGRALLIFELCLGTGARIGDVLRMRWNDLKEGGVVIRQGKTRKPAWLPLTAPLRAALEATPRRGLTITSQANGLPTSYRGAADMVMKVRKAIGAEAYDLHALRHSTASELLAAGCSDEQVAAVLGHSSLATVPIYTASVRQMERAKQAQGKRDK